MSTSSFLKILSLAGIGIALLIGLGAVHDLVNEREGRRMEAIASIANGAGGSVQLGPPALRVTARVPNGPDVERVLLPASVNVSADVAVDERRRGIFETRVFAAKQHIKARFVLPAGFGLARDADASTWAEGTLELGVSDLRGLHGTPKVTWSGLPVTVTPGTSGGTGFRAELGKLDGASAQTVDCEIELTIGGTGTLSWAPAAAETVVSVRSPWKHPSFVGAFLPVTRDVSASGFAAQWAVTDLATGLARDGGRDTLRKAGAQNFGLSLVEPVDAYALVSRATKYGLLFVLVTFVGLLLVERLARLSLHPVQYGLAGAAVTVFFLLLLALAEHLGFSAAFGIGTAACVLLLTAYLVPVLGSRGRGLSAGALFTAMYALLYTLLHAEDQALLFGATLVFALLAAVMLGTRKVDWGRLGGDATPTPPPSEPVTEA